MTARVGRSRAARAGVLGRAQSSLEASLGPGAGDRQILVAVSGGIDSVVLLDALQHLAPPLGLVLAVGHVNHALRGSEADADQRFVETLAAKRGLPVGVRAVDPQGARKIGPSRIRPSLEEAARELRYAALRAIAAELGSTVIATAHQADDQAETVLLRLLRGTGPDGLGGIPERSGDGLLVRPLLRVSRAEIEAYAVARQLTWREDASNASPAFARNRLRGEWIPGLAREFNPRLLQRIADLAEAQRRDSEWIATLVAAEAARRMWREEATLRLARDGWAALPDALARRLARHALIEARAGRDVSRAQLERIVAFLGRPRRGKRLELPGGLILSCDARSFCLAPCGVREEPAC